MEKNRKEITEIDMDELYLIVLCAGFADDGPSWLDNGQIKA